jgi:hypothetical protein
VPAIDGLPLSPLLFAQDAAALRTEALPDLATLRDGLASLAARGAATHKEEQAKLSVVLEQLQQTRQLVDAGQVRTDCMGSHAFSLLSWN